MKELQGKATSMIKVAMKMPACQHMWLINMLTLHPNDVIRTLPQNSTTWLGHWHLDHMILGVKTSRTTT